MQALFDRNVDTLEDFLIRWYGPPQREYGAEVEVDDSVPSELVAWHRMVSGWDHPLTAQDYPMPLSKLRTRNGKMIFWVENQGGYVWAVDLSNVGRRVYMANPGDDWIWEDAGLTLNDFLVYVTLREAILASENTVFVPSLPSAYEHVVMREFAPLGLFSKADPDPASRLYVGRDALVEVSTPPGGYPNGPGDRMLILAAIDSRALQRYLSLIEPQYLEGGTPARFGVGSTW